MKKLLYVLISALAISCASNSQQKEKEEAERKADSIVLQAQKDYEKEKAERVKSVSQEKKQQENTEKKVFEGEYYCRRTGDTFVFRSNHSGLFIPQGAYVTSTFIWKRNGTKIHIKYTGDSDYLGKSTLTYDKDFQQITEISESFGELDYDKKGSY